MQLPPEDSPTLRFDVFTLDLRAGELYKTGHKIKLQEQPFQILAMLLEQPGKVVTREQLRERLWPEDTFVDFDHSLNTAVKKLRQALNDEADKPHFIETLPKRGYRFVGPAVEGLQAPQSSRGKETDSIAHENEGKREAKSTRTATGTPLPATRWKILAPVAILIVAIGAGAYFLTHKNLTLTEKGTIVIADFSNSTGDPVFDDTLKQGLAVQLAQSPFLVILSDEKVHVTLKLMGRAPGERLTPEIARDLCQRAGSSAVIDGSIAKLEDAYIVGLNAVDCRTGENLAREQITSEDKRHVLAALGKAAQNLRGKLGESFTSIQKYDTPIEQATTSSLEALKAYSAGWKISSDKGDADAIPFFKRAINLDPNFALAYADLGASYSTLQEPGLASENLKTAYDLRDRVSERENFRISASYYMRVTEELEKANQTLALWAQAYPRDPEPHDALALNCVSLGQHEKALAEALEELRLDPSADGSYINLVGEYTALNRLDEAKATYEQAQVRKINHPFLHGFRYGVAFLEGDAAEMERQLAWSAGKPGAEDLLLSQQSDTEGFFGRLAKAREFSRRAVETARHSDQKETAAEWQANAALREAEFGNPGLAQQETASALDLASTRDVKILASLAQARTGDSARAEKVANDLAKQFPLNTVLNDYWLPTIRASIEINRNHLARAIEVLQVAAPYELGAPLPEPEVLGLLYPTYVRGQAYLLLYQGGDAAAEFQKFLDHRGIVQNCPLGALARLGLARAYSMQGDTARAHAAYQDFLRLWKDADPDIPILIASKSEYAKMK